MSNLRGLVSSATITRPSNTTQYAANDVIATGTSSSEFSGLSAFAGGGGIIQSALIVSSNNATTKLSCDLLLFSEAQTTAADNAAYAPTDAMMLTLLGSISFATGSWLAANAGAAATGNAYCVAVNCGIALSQDTVHGVLVARNTYTPVSDEVLTIKLFSRY